MLWRGSRWRRESLTATLVAVAAALVAFDMLPWPTAVFATIFAALVAAAAVHDVVAYRLPDALNAAIFALGLLFVVLDADPSFLSDDLLAALMRAAIVGGGLWLLRAAHSRLRGRTGLGLGDVKLAAAGAVWLPLEQLAYAILLASLSALIAAGWQKVAQRADGGDQDVLVPFGAFLGPAVWVIWYFARLGLLAGYGLS